MTTTSDSNNTRNKLANSVRRAKTTQAAAANKDPAKKTAPVGSSENPVKANAEKLPSTKASSSQGPEQNTPSTSTGQRVWPD
jgi:hypothetical protein